jgi:hypothetical protein
VTACYFTETGTLRPERINLSEMCDTKEEVAQKVELMLIKWIKGLVSCTYFCLLKKFGNISLQE